MFGTATPRVPKGRKRTLDGKTLANCLPMCNQVVADWSKSFEGYLIGPSKNRPMASIRLACGARGNDLSTRAKEKEVVKRAVN